MEYILSPSILSADFKDLAADMKKTEDNGATYLHFDVMDGLFVPSISFGMPVLKSIHTATGQFMDVHLMIQEPIRYIDAFKEAGADGITIHYEACEDVDATLAKIREAGLKTGLAISPDTPADVLIPYADKVDMLLVMTVYPGFGGQKLIPETLEKVKVLRKHLTENGLNTLLQVDGGVGLANADEVIACGANVLVAGSAIFKDTAENTKKFMEILKKYE